jgi:hypothetical protein
MAARAGGNLHVGFSFDWADEEDLVRRMDESTRSSEGSEELNHWWHPAVPIGFQLETVADLKQFQLFEVTPD